MMPNMLFVALAAILPSIIGFIYYNPKVFGNVWMKAAGVTEEQIKTGNKVKIFGIALLLSFLIAFMLYTLVVHQTHYYSLLYNEEGFGVEGSDIMNQIAAFMDAYGGNFRTFKHGALHGSMIGIFIGLPIIITSGLFEAKSLKYGFINAFYWIITLSLMGGILCQWA
ncbi:MAG: hypothetical protein ACJATF_004191 [Flavobacteriales bacterium]|jgi:hypothetical protein